MKGGDHMQNGQTPNPDPYSAFVSELGDSYKRFIRDSDNANDAELRIANAVVEHLIVLDPHAEAIIDPT
jgi:hypothetical protein